MADAPKEAVKIEDAKADTAPSKDKKVSNQPNDMPPLENPDIPPSSEPVDDANKEATNKQSKNEKKSRKAVQKLGLKPVSGITKVTLRKGKNYLFVINQPEVYKSPASDTYIIFGEAKVEDTSTAAFREAAEKFKTGESAKAEQPPLLVDAAQQPAGGSKGAAEAVTEEGVSEKDIQLVLDQAPNATRAQAVQALKKTNGDIVAAIMELTT